MRRCRREYIEIFAVTVLGQLHSTPFICVCLHPENFPLQTQGFVL